MEEVRVLAVGVVVPAEEACVLEVHAMEVVVEEVPVVVVGVD